MSGQPDYIEGKLQFAVDTGVKPATYPGRPGPIKNTGEFKDETVKVANARSLRNDLTLDRNGFLLTDHETACKDFFDEDHLRAVYYEECKELVKRFTGADTVAIFDHTYRLQDDAKREAKGTGGPVLTVHNDYTDWSGPQRLRDITPKDEVDMRLSNRFVMVNVWRPLMEPVQSRPLALCDAQTLTRGDLVAADHIYPNRRGETYRIAFNENQRWYCFPEMTMSEAVLIKCFDSHNQDHAYFSAHGALQDTPPPGTPPRESIEVRTIAYFDPA